MERDEGGISSKAPRIKIKQNPDCPNKEYNVIFKNFHQNIRTYRRKNNKFALINDW